MTKACKFRWSRPRPVLPALLTLVLILGAAAGCQPAAKEEGNMAFRISTTAFSDGATVPVKYTCDGQNNSPPLDWTAPPAGTQAFALTVFDPDASGSGFVHWVIFNIPASSRRLGEAVPASSRLDDGTLQGNNGAGKIGYTGPCPPAGKPHHYHFDLYALDGPLDLKAGATYSQVNSAIKGHVLAQASVIGLYQR